MAAALLAPCLVACVGPPKVVVPNDGSSPTFAPYADAVLYTDDGDHVTTCTESFPNCTTQTVQTLDCSGSAALGQDDGVPFDITPLGRIELAFICRGIIETGTSADFRIFATVEGGAGPYVEVSDDSITYYPVNPWPFSTTSDHADFDLQVPMLTDARFVRISETANAGVIHLDAIQSLRGSQ